MAGHSHMIGAIGASSFEPVCCHVNHFPILRNCQQYSRQMNRVLPREADSNRLEVPGLTLEIPRRINAKAPGI